MPYWQASINSNDTSRKIELKAATCYNSSIATGPFYRCNRTCSQLVLILELGIFLVQVRHVLDDVIQNPAHRDPTKEVELPNAANNGVQLIAGPDNRQFESL